jgi:hypothetical protein
VTGVQTCALPIFSRSPGTAGDTGFLGAHNDCAVCHGAKGNANNPPDGFVFLDLTAQGGDAYTAGMHRDGSVQINVQRGLAVNDLLRWFEPVGDDWRVADELRRLVEFRVDNLFEPKLPKAHYDLILCRNVLLYFSLEMRRKVFEQLAERSRAGSYLVLGAGETVIGQTDAFAASREFRGSYERRPMTDLGTGALRRAG